MFNINSQNISIINNNKFINNNINNIENCFNNNLVKIKINNINDNINDNIVAILIFGQVRTFISPDIYNSLKYELNKLKENNIKYHVFFYIEPSSMYDKSKKINVPNLEHISKNKIRDIINNITNNYSLLFYDIKDILSEIPIILNISNTGINSYYIQYYLLYKTYKQVIEYENKNNIKFKYIIKSRPDFQYKKSIIQFLNFDSLDNTFYFQSDILFILPRHLSEVINNIIYILVSSPNINIFKNKLQKIDHYIFHKKNSILIKNKHNEYLLNLHLIIPSYLKLLDYDSMFIWRGDVIKPL
jgi:hypothetical protein